MEDDCGGGPVVSEGAEGRGCGAVIVFFAMLWFISYIALDKFTSWGDGWWGAIVAVAIAAVVLGLVSLVGYKR